MNRELKKQIAKAFDAPTPGRKVQFIHSLPARISVPKHLYAAKFPLSRKAYG